MVSRWTTSKRLKKIIEILSKLKHLGGFFNTYKNLMYKGGLKITFKRNNNDMTCHVWGKAGNPL